ncbi:TetR/AcrR family transcriptional regulator [Plantactinospora sp. GCM10030261]|uniref:TetR/AcrR family transcriptional regulator n=1 Tax=Plantactinospora sp. GCM10030261 TaxID=3273420 RepID=UPI00361A695E
MVQRGDEAVPVPPWRARSGRTRAPLTQAVIVTAALELVERAGVEAVSMRTVAEALGTGPSSIYRHVAGKDELLELVLDQVLGEVRIPPPDADDWRRPLRELAHEVRRVLLGHGDIAAVALSGRPVGGNPVRIAEGLLAILRTAGFDDRVSAWVVDRLSLYVTADALDVARRRLSAASGTERWNQVAEYYRALPEQRFPHTVAVLGELFAGDEADRFAAGLDIFLDGLDRRRP